jgi:hypothetical protein
MKKTLRVLPLVAVGLVVVLAFTGCDKILEVVFPNETGQGGGGGSTYTVIFNVNLPTAAIADWNRSEIIVKILGPDNFVDMRRSLARPPAQPGGDATMMARFENLPSGGYQGFAWLDKNGNAQPDSDEPYGVAEGGREYFGLPEGDFQTSTFNIRLFVPDISGGNRVTATVRVPQTVLGWNTPNALMMTLENLDGVVIFMPNRRATATPEDPTMGRFEFVYDGLPGGSYRAYAWLDLNGNLTRDPEEPQGVPGQEFFGLPVGGAVQQSFDIMLVAPVAGGLNTVTVTVRIATTILNWNSPDWLMVMLEKQDGGQIYQPTRRTTAVPDATDPNWGVGTFTYDNVPGGFYRAFGWLDIDGDGQPTLNQGGVNEPYGVPNTNEYFSLPSTGATTINLSVDVGLAATGTATINWNVHVEQAIPSWNAADVVKVFLERTDASPIANANRSATAVYESPAHGLAPVVYGQLAEGWYRGTVWVDANFNWIKEPAEFGQVTPDFWISQGAVVYQEVWIANVVTYSDSYEPDNDWTNAKYIWVNDPRQLHYLDSADQDWMYFWADYGSTYVIETHSPDGVATMDTWLELYDQNGTTLLRQDDDGGEYAFSLLTSWTPPTSGYYYVMVRGYAWAATGGYSVDVIRN